MKSQLSVILPPSPSLFFITDTCISLSFIITSSLNKDITTSESCAIACEYLISLNLGAAFVLDFFSSNCVLITIGLFTLLASFFKSRVICATLNQSSLAFWSSSIRYTPSINTMSGFTSLILCSKAITPVAVSIYNGSKEGNSSSKNSKYSFSTFGGSLPRLNCE